MALVFMAGLLIATVGIPVNNHYCGGSYYTTTIGLPITDPCTDMPMENNCCDDQTTLFSVTDMFNNPSVIVWVQGIAPALLTCNYTECIKAIPQAPVAAPFVAGSPPRAEARIFVRVQSLLL